MDTKSTDINVREQIIKLLADKNYSKDGLEKLSDDDLQKMIQMNNLRGIRRILNFFENLVIFLLITGLVSVLIWIYISIH